MTTVTELVNAVPPAIRRHKNRIYGFVPAIVIAVWDPRNEKRHQQGYVQVYFPGMQLEADHVRSAKSDPEKGVSPLRDADPLIAPWARVATPELGVYQIPQLGDEVLVAFEHGDPHYPYVVGSLFNGNAPIPKPVTDPDTESNRPEGCPATPDMSGDAMAGSGGEKNQVMFWRSHAGNVIVLNDATGHMRIADGSGHSVFQLNGDRIEILQSAKDIRINAKNKVTFDCTDFEVYAKKCITKNTSKYTAQAGSDFAQSAQATLTMASKGNFSTTSGTDWVAYSKDKIEAKAKSGAVNLTSGGDLSIVAPKGQCALESKGVFSAVTPMKFAMGAKGNIKIKGDGVVNINAAINLKFKGANCLVNCGADAGFSLFDAIWNGIKRITAQVVKGVIGAAKAVGGAIVAGATALGRAALAGMQAVGRIAGAAATAVAQVGRKVATTAWDVTRAVGGAMVDVGRAAGGAAVGVAQAGVRAVNHAATGVARAAHTTARVVQQGVQTAGRAVLGGVGAGLVAGGRAVSGAGQVMQNAGNALIGTNQRASGAVVRSAGVAGGAAPLDVQTAIENLIATVNRGNRQIAEATGQRYREQLEAIWRESERALLQVGEIVHGGDRAFGAVAVDLGASSVPVATLASPSSEIAAEQGGEPTPPEPPAAPVTTAGAAAPTLPPRLRRMVQVPPGMRDLSGQVMPLANPSQIVRETRLAESRSY